MTGERYALVDEKGQVHNVVLWDGDPEGWQPPEGQEAVALADDSPIGPGDVIDVKGNVVGSFELPTLQATPTPDAAAFGDLAEAVAGAKTLAALQTAIVAWAHDRAGGAG